MRSADDAAPPRYPPLVRTGTSSPQRPVEEARNLSLTRKLRIGLPIVAVTASCAQAGVATARTIVVRPHHSIQAAIDKAKRGDTVVVQRGTYREALVINTDRLTLKGRSAVLRPPASAPDTPCSKIDPSGVTGICVIGDVTPGNPPTVNKTVNRVTIFGITVRGFTGNGILGFATKNLTVSHTHLLENGSYGVFSNTSSGTRYLHNVSRGNNAPGLYIGDSPHGHGLVIGNRSVNNAGEGLLARNADFGTVRDNVFTRNCAGILVLADAPGPATDWKVSRNNVARNNKACAGDPAEGEPPLSGIGIGLLGAANTTVTNNSVTDNAKGSNPSVASGGILVMTFPGGSTAPQNDTVKNNHLSGNSPFDLFWDMTGTATFSGNHCETSSPAGLCKKK
jgi:nitrous oxidase accessory protein NosD